MFFRTFFGQNVASLFIMNYFMRMYEKMKGRNESVASFELNRLSQIKARKLPFTISEFCKQKRYIIVPL